MPSNPPTTTHTTRRFHPGDNQPTDTMKNIESATTETLATNATIIGANGLIEATGLTVQLVTEPDFSEYDSRYIIGRTEHAASDIIHDDNELRSLAAGWTVILKSAAAQSLRAIPSAKREAASRSNGAKGGRPRKING